MLRVAILFVFVLTMSAQTAKVKFVIGKVEVKHKGETNWLTVRRSTKLLQGDQIKTAFESRLEIETPDKTIIRLKENSILDLNMIKTVGKKETANKVKLWGGSLWAKFTKLFSDEEENTISTPTAVAAIRGTSLIVGFDGSGSSFNLITGLIEVRTSKQTIQVKPGTTAKVNENGYSEVTETKNTKDDDELINNESFTPDSTDTSSGFGEKGEEASEDKTPNFLEIDQSSETITNEADIQSGITISGITRSDAQLRVAGTLITLGSDGSFSTVITPREGVVKVDIDSRSKYGNITQSLTFRINVSSPELFLDQDGQIFTNEPAFNLAIQASDLTPDDLLSVYLNNRLLKAGASPINIIEPVILVTGVNNLVVDLKDEVGHTVSQPVRVVLDNTAPEIQITAGTEPFTPTTSFGERPPGVPDLPFIFVPRIIRGFVKDLAPSSGIRELRINGVQIDVKPSNDFQFTLEMTDEIKNKIIAAYRTGGNDFIDIPVYVEDYAGNQYNGEDSPIRIEIIIPVRR
jgi:hypothetical protein